MAGSGPAPKHGRSRSRDTPERTNLADERNRPRELVKSATKLGPTLPRDVLPGGETWHPVTRKWWDHWRSSPQAARMLSEPDWDVLLDTALMHHQMWSKGRWEFAAEIRLRVAKFGATPEDRLRLRSEIQVPETTPVGDAAEESVTSLDSRRGRIKD
ncbi:hypothetical protein ACFP5Z_06625 [Kocuria oceani]